MFLLLLITSSIINLFTIDMGNCLIRNNQISAQDDDNFDERPGDAVVEQMKISSSFKSGPAAVPEENMKKKKTKKKKKVRFELQNDEGRSKESFSDSRRGSVRIRLVVTQEELKRILSYENDSRQASLQQLLSSVKVKGSRIREVGDDDGAVNAWRPTLESIPEDGSMK